MNGIKEIYNKVSILIHRLQKLVYYFRIQNYDFALRSSAEILNGLIGLTDKLLLNSDYFNENEVVITRDSINNILHGILNAQENRDYILLADIYEAQFIPYLLKLQEIIIRKEEYIFNEEDYNKVSNIISNRYPDLAKELKKLSHPLNLLNQDYIVEYTASGFMTLATLDNKKFYYFHSNNQPMNEAFQLANSWYQEEKTEYIIYGLGLGYHINELYNIDDSISIEVYESDINIIQLACAFGHISQILMPTNIKLIYDPDFILLNEKLKDIDNNAEFVIHYPSLRNIKNKDIKENLESYFIQYSSVKNQLPLLNGNFRENIKHFDYSVDNLKDLFYKKDLYIVAAGPSLDNNFMQLKEIRDNNKGIILATGTVFRKLINAGIVPDYLIVTDANPRVYAQITGLEHKNVPMLYLSTAHRGFATNYNGLKYLICQYDYPHAEKLAAEKKLNLYKTGGSVSTTALDIGIRLGCKRIIFLGLDLAYPNNLVHAYGTSRRNLSNTDDLKQVEDIHGDMIYTSNSLNIYRKWIEKRIEGIKNIDFIDATEGGAKITGMKVMNLKDVYRC